MGSEGVRLERVGGTDSRPLARVFLALLLVVSLVHLASQLVAPGRMLGEATQVLLMPMLGGFILASTLRRGAVPSRWRWPRCSSPGPEIPCRG